MAQISYYDLNPIQVIDQNHWTVQMPEVNFRFQRNATYTPLIDWSYDLQKYNTTDVIETEAFQGDSRPKEIALTANYVSTAAMPDTRFRKWSVKRYADKVMLHESQNIFNQWKISGESDWRPLLRGVLGDAVVGSVEWMARKSFFQLPKTYWRNASGKADWGALGGDGDTFGIEEVNYWNFSLGNTGSPVIPGDMAAAKVAYIAPGAHYDFRRKLAAASGNEAAMWRDAAVYSNTIALRNEIGTYSGVRFFTPPNDIFGENPNVLYNAGAITKQYGVVAPIKTGDGSPDPETTPVDGTWYVGQKGVTHHIKLESFTNGDFEINDFVTIHVKALLPTDVDYHGVENGVDPLDEMTVNRRIVAVDNTNKTISVDHPISFDFTSAFIGQSVTGATPGTFYAYVTKGKNIGYSIVLGSRGGVKSQVMKPLKFYNPKPVDDFDSVWRFTFDHILGMNLADPNLFQLYFYAVSVPKPGGVITA